VTEDDLLVITGAVLKLPQLLVRRDDSRMLWVCRLRSVVLRRLLLRRFTLPVRH
jgi:hypothetical protein